MIGALDEACGGCGGISMFPYNCCGAQASGCDGRICLVGSGSTEDCLCDDQSFNLYSISVVPFSSGAAGGGTVQLNKDGRGSVTVSECGTYQWQYNIPPNPHPFCHNPLSGYFEYGYSGIPGDCGQIVPITIPTKNHWCNTNWQLDQGQLNTFETTITESDSSATVRIDYVTDVCPHEGNLFDGNTATKEFCTFCEYCEYQATITVCNGQTGGETIINLPGNHNGPDSYLATVGGPGPTCAIACKTTIVSGIVEKGPHTISAHFGRSLSSYIPVGSYLDMTFSFGTCWNEPEPCVCSLLEKDALHADWDDQCFGTPVDDRVVSLSYSEDSCTWTSDCIFVSGRPATVFVLICRDGCCKPPDGFPFDPKGLSDDTNNIYLYEFYKTNATGCAGYLDWDYYIWKKNSNCNPLEFQRAWKKCVGSVSEASLDCEHSFRLYTACSGAWLSECETCDINVYVHGLENHYPLRGEYSIYGSGGLILDGTIDNLADGFVSNQLPSGEAPWWFVFEGNDCYSPVSGEVDCQEVIYLYAETGPNCVVHSGACTLCNGIAIKKTLYLTDNFGQDTLNWNDVSNQWEGTDLSLRCHNNEWSMAGNLSGCHYVNFYVSSGNFTWDCEPLDINVFSNIPSGCIGNAFRYKGTITE